MLPLRVSDIKQYLYCSRITYYHYVVPVDRKVSFKMDHGREQHFEIERLERRRRLTRYGLDQGERRFRLPLHSERLGLTGVLDLLLLSPAGYFPVDYKHTTGAPALGHKYQLVGYSLLVEEALGVTVKRGFIYLIPTNRVVEVAMSANARTHFRRLMGAVRNIVRGQRMPAATPSPWRCCDCEFRRYCGDR